MTLLELATFICTKVNQSEAEDLAACKNFLQRRLDMIWADQLWHDALFEYTQTLSATGYDVNSTWLPTKQVLLLPVQFSHPVAVRTSTQKMSVLSSEELYRMDYNTFENSGTPIRFRVLSQCVWEFDIAQTVSVDSDAAADSSKARVVSLAADGVTLNAINQTLSGGISLGAILRLDAVTKGETDGSLRVVVNPALTVHFTGAFTLGVGLNTNDPTQSSLDLTQGQSGPLTVNIGDTLYFFFDGVFLGGSYVVTDRLGTLTVVDALANQSFVSITDPLLTLGPDDTASDKRCRIQLFGSIPDGAVIRVLGKTKCPAFTEDGDEPALVGVENALLAFAQADMLQRERQYGKAQVLQQEGQLLLEQLKKVRTVQQAHNKRLIPDSGYGDDYGLLSGSLYTV